MGLRYNPGAPVPGFPGGLTVPVLLSGQYSIDNFVFGRGTQLTVQQTAVDPVTFTTQDQPVGAGDGQRFGVDYATGGKIYTFTGNVLQTNTNDQIGAMDTYAALEAYWNNPAIRLNPGSVSTLRFRYPNSPVTRRVYGRGRAITPTLGMVSRGNVPFIAAFQAADGNAYSDVLTTIKLSLGGVSVSGVENIISNPQFKEGTQGYTWTGGVLSTDTTHLHSTGASGKFVPNGTTANPTITSPFCPVVNNKGYTVANWFFITSALSVPVKFIIELYDVNFNPLSQLASDTVSLTANTWRTQYERITINNVNARWATIQAQYQGTPTVSDILWVGDYVFQFPSSGRVIQPIAFGGTTLPFTWVANTNKSAQLAVDNSGLVDTYPIITIQGPVTNPAVNFIEPDLGIGIQGAVPRGTYVVIDTQPWHRTVLSGNGDSWAGKIIGNALTELVLPPGITNVAFSGEDTGGTSAATVQWRTAYPMIGGTSI